MSNLRGPNHQPTDPAGDARRKLNAYFCSTCGNAIVTVDRDEGVTPMFLACRATEGCPGRSVSQMPDPTPDARSDGVPS